MDPIQRFLTRYEEGSIDVAFDGLFQTIDMLAFDAKFAEVDEILHLASLTDLSSRGAFRMRIGLLTITLPFKTHLVKRHAIVQQVRTQAYVLGGESKVRACLHGLE